LKPNTVLFGASKLGQIAIKSVSKNFNIIGFCDNDPCKWGKIFQGYKIFSPAKLYEYQGIKIIITSSYYNEIAKQLLNMGFTDFVPYIYPEDETRKRTFAEIAEECRKIYYIQGNSYEINCQEYECQGDYLNFSKIIYNNEYSFDSKGIPLFEYKKSQYYHPVYIIQFLLGLYGSFLNGESLSGRFLTVSSHFIKMQDESGAFRYPFQYDYYLGVLEAGWVSGMAQGQAMSVFARAFHLTHHPKYLEVGNKAFDFLTTPVSRGGVMNTLADLNPELKDHLIFEEYVIKPASYTLNGFMFALLGVYDWWQVHPDKDIAEKAKYYFHEGIKTLKKILPLYDIGGFTAYDLSYITHKRQPHIGIFYHAVHIYMLHALYSITQDDELKKYELLWASYVDK
jgi:hypothetical protein